MIAAHADDRTFVDVMCRQARSRADRIAFTFLHDGEGVERQVTWGQLDCRARAIAAHLRSVGARGERVLLPCTDTLAYVEALFACFYAGAIAVPVPEPRPGRHAERLVGIVADADAKWALVDRESSAHARVLGSLGVIETVTIPDELCSTWQPRRGDIADDSVALLQYTSGSTTLPRGVMLSHRNLLSNAVALDKAFGQGVDAVTVGWLPLFHDMGLVGTLLHTAFAGSSAVLMSPAAFLQRPARWLRAVSVFRGAISGGPNFAYQLCVDRIVDDDVEGIDLSSWRVAFAGGESNRATTLERFAARFAAYGFARGALCPAYGLAEATLFVSGTRPGAGPRTIAADGTAGGPGGRRTLVTSGQTAEGARVVIVDADTAVPCPDGAIGEVWVSGEAVALGYWRQPGASASQFEARLAGDSSSRFLRTGDLGLIRDGDLLISGRAKDVILVRGTTHYPDDLELTAQESHRLLNGAGSAAFALDEQDEERLVIVQEVPASARSDCEVLLSALREAIASAHGITPHAIVLVRAGVLPRTSSGKIQRHVCRRQFKDGTLRAIGAWTKAPGHDSLVTPAGTTSVDPAEAWVVAEVARVTGVAPETIDADLPITRYGIDSLSSMALSHAAHRACGVSLSSAELLNGATVRALAARLRNPPVAPVAGDDIPRVPNRSCYRLSYGQRGLWFLHQMDPASSVYNISTAVRVRTPIDMAALRIAFARLIDRHEVLRTVFTVDASGEPVQRVLTDEVEQLQIVEEAEPTPGASDELWVRQRIGEAAAEPFDLAVGPLFRFRVYRQRSGETILLMVLHHAVADYWSLAVVTRELCLGYEAAIERRPWTPPPLALTYRDYCEWQASMLQSDRGAALAAYWHRQLHGDLPTFDALAPAKRSTRLIERAGRLEVEVERALFDTIAAFARDHDATLYMVLLAGFFALVQRYTGQDDLVISSPVAGRAGRGLQDQVGLFVNMLLLRIHIDGGTSFETVVSRVRQTVLDAFEHQEYPFALLTERLQMRGINRSSLLQLMFVFQKAAVPGCDALGLFAVGQPDARLELGGLTLESFPVDQSVQCDCQLIASEADGRLVLSWRYDAGLFEPAMIEAMADAYLTLLRHAVRQPSTAIACQPLLGAERDREVGVEGSLPDRGVSIPRAFERQAAATPDAEAFICGDRALTFRQVDRRANQIAHYLVARRLAPDSAVGVCMMRGLESVTAVLGILKAGCAYVPLDPRYPADRLVFMAADSRCSIVFVDQGGDAALPSSPSFERVDLSRSSAMLDQCSTNAPEMDVDSENAAYVIYTSGSTGRPKGVTGLHSGAINRFEWMWTQYPFRSDERCCQKTSLNFLDSLWEMFGPTLRGVPVVIVPDEVVQDAERLVEVLERERITRVVVVPSQLGSILDALDYTGIQLRALHTWVTSGEALDGGLAERFRQKLPGRRLLNLYGTSEISADVTCHEIDAGTAGFTSVPIGRPITNCGVFILDDRLEKVPFGMPGDLYVSGAGLARGYVGRPDLTAESFVPSPFQRGQRLYRTGDRARWLAEGVLQYLGRADRQVKIRGFRIELGEVEAVLRTHPAVRDAAVIASAIGSDAARLLACVVFDANQAVPISDVRGFVRTRLPDFMTPAAIVPLPALPLTASGKVDRLALAALTETLTDGGVDGSGVVAPRTETECAVAAVWKEVLAIESFGVHDDFFALGGHSLLVTRVAAKLKSRLAVELPLRTLFAAPTVAALAAEIGRRASSPTARPSASIRRQPRGLSQSERSDRG